MRLIWRFAALTSLCLATSVALARTSLLRESVDTYQRAVSEANQSKAAAMLQGLLMERVSFGVDPTSVPVNAKGYERGIERGLKAWNSALGENLFVFQRDPHHADIVVSFVEKVSGADRAQGHTRAQRRFAWDKGQSMAVITGSMKIRDTAGSRSIQEAEIAAVTAHEIGHLLGLQDDFSGSGIMSDFHAGKKCSISTDEVKTVKSFRQKIRAALNKVKQAL